MINRKSTTCAYIGIISSSPRGSYLAKEQGTAALHLSRALYKSALFMQNKPNFLNNQMSISQVMTEHYEHKMPLRPPAKQTQLNPISLAILSAEFCSNASPVSGFTRIYCGKAHGKTPKFEIYID